MSGDLDAPLKLGNRFLRFPDYGHTDLMHKYETSPTRLATKRARFTPTTHTTRLLTASPSWYPSVPSPPNRGAERRDVSRRTPPSCEAALALHPTELPLRPS